VVRGIRDVLAPESIAALRGSGESETFLGGQHSLSAGHSVKFNSGNN